MSAYRNKNIQVSKLLGAMGFLLPTTTKVSIVRGNQCLIWLSLIEIMKKVKTKIATKLSKVQSKIF